MEQTESRLIISPRGVRAAFKQDNESGDPNRGEMRPESEDLCGLRADNGLLRAETEIRIRAESGWGGAAIPQVRTGAVSDFYPGAGMQLLHRLRGKEGKTEQRRKHPRCMTLAACNDQGSAWLGRKWVAARAVTRTRIEVMLSNYKKQCIHDKNQEN